MHNLSRSWLSNPTPQLRSRTPAPAAAVALLTQPLLSLALLTAILATGGAHAQTFNILYTFTGGSDGYYETGGVIRDSAGNLYGTTASGGDAICVSPYGCGTIFKVDPSGNKSVLYSFTGGTDGGVAFRLPDSRLRRQSLRNHVLRRLSRVRRFLGLRHSLLAGFVRPLQHALPFQGRARRRKPRINPGPRREGQPLWHDSRGRQFHVLQWLRLWHRVQD